MTQSFVMSFAPPLITKVGTLILGSRSTTVQVASGPPLEYYKYGLSACEHGGLETTTYHI